MRGALPLILLVYPACCLSVAQEGAPATTTSGSSSGGINGCGTTGGASVPLPPGPCGPGTSWVGDTCVVSCAAPVVSPFDGLDNVCLLPDGGFGNCADGACLAPGDPNNCGGLGLVCPPPWSCIANVYGSYCGSHVGNRGVEFSCDGDTCPGTAPQCVPQRGCVSSCGPCSDNQSCLAGDAGQGFCCDGACKTFGSNPGNCLGCGVGCSDSATICGPADLGAGCHLADGGHGACCGRRCADPAAVCDAVASCSGAMDGTLCARDDGGDGECCASRCSDLQDSENCGVCSVACGPDAFCAGGACKPLLDCANGGAQPGYNGNCLTDAGGVGWCCESMCLDLAHDPQNCGTCGSSCPVGGTCAAFSGGYETKCIDELGRPLLCDGGAQCTAGRSCVYGACLPSTCDGYQTSCISDGGFGFCCGTECTAFDDLGCGGACPSGTVPSHNGGPACTTPDGGPPCGPGAACPAGTYCLAAAGECVPLDSCLPSFKTPLLSYCWTGPSVGQCCGDACVDFSQDPNNCGGCGIVCSTGICIDEFANIGSLWPLCLPAGPTNDCLLSCPADSACLRGRCVNGVSEDINLPFCLAADGTIGAYCNPGVCANPRNDPQNCGSCGNACGPGQSCVAGSCTGRPGCGNGREGFFCNFDAGTSYACCPSVGCTDTDTDPDNCGFCGQQCLHGSRCLGGTCE